MVIKVVTQIRKVGLVLLKVFLYWSTLKKLRK